MANKSKGSLLRLIIAIAVLLTSSQAFAQPTRLPVEFISVDLLDDETDDKADEKLMRYLESKANIEFDWRPLDYGSVITRLEEWKGKDAFYLARTTPYVYIVAEMLGADFEVLATYRSHKTGKTTYSAHFVVKKSDLAITKPTPSDLVSYIQQRERPAKFIYHSKFSTSSYFLPSLFFRSRNIFSIEKATENLFAIHSEQPEGIGSSSTLLEYVAQGKADLAAVWDGKKIDYEKGEKYDNYGSKVHFIRLATLLPNDLLVCSTSLDASIKNAIRNAIRSMTDNEQDHINIGDFKTWVDLNAATDEATAAREALADLRWAAKERQAPVTVDIRKARSKKFGLEDWHLEAARQAVRLSGTEFILYDQDFHKSSPDVIWTLELIHDGAIELTSDIKAVAKLKPQEFQISFENAEDLTTRIGFLIHSRMHRIRYIWPYEDKAPKVIRDVAFPLPQGAQVYVQKITWKDPDKNIYIGGENFAAKVEETDFYKFQLSDAKFPKTSDGTKFDFDPMSNIMYRVILVRASHERAIFRYLTIVFVGLLVMAAVGLVLDVRRKSKIASDRVPMNGKLFQSTCQEMVEDYHQPWQDRQIAEVNVLWCNRPRIEELITELKAGGLKPKFDKIRRYRERGAIAIHLPFLKNIFGSTIELERTVELITDPSKVSDTSRLGTLIRFLVVKRQLSCFIGRPLEWDALNTMTYQVLLNQFKGDPNQGELKGSGLLLPENPALLTLISKHCNEVLQESLHKISFFRQTWNIEKSEDRFLLTHRQKLSGNLHLKDEEEPVNGLILEFNVPSDADLHNALSGHTIDAWLLGKINRRSCSTKEGIRYLCLHFRTFALVRD
ncbi:MAG: phosphate/phosphite/phosphonate ABC transporter substrate-binding protein [bacterium]